MSQLSPYGRPTVYQDSLFAGVDPLQDSHFLINCTDVLSLFPEESATGLHAAFALMGDRQLSVGNSVPFLQVVTQSAADIVLHGAIVVRRPDDSYVLTEINTMLPQITVGPAPNLAILPVPPPEPIVTPQPPVTPALPQPQPTATPAILSPQSPNSASTNQPALIEIPPTVITRPTDSLPPESQLPPSVVTIQPNLPDVLLGYDPLIVPTFMPISVLQTGLISRIDGVPDLYAGNGYFTTYSEDVAMTLDTVQLAYFNSNDGMQALMKSNLADGDAANTPEPATCAIIAIGVVGYVITTAPRRRS